jgi:hypothetical protein
VAECATNPTIARALFARFVALSGIFAPVDVVHTGNHDDGNNQDALEGDGKPPLTQKDTAAYLRAGSERTSSGGEAAPFTLQTIQATGPLAIDEHASTCRGAASNDTAGALAGTLRSLPGTGRGDEGTPDGKGHGHLLVTTAGSENDGTSTLVDRAGVVTTYGKLEETFGASSVEAHSATSIGRGKDESINPESESQQGILDGVPTATAARTLATQSSILQDAAARRAAVSAAAQAIERYPDTSSHGIHHKQPGRRRVPLVLLPPLVFAADLAGGMYDGIFHPAAAAASEDADSGTSGSLPPQPPLDPLGRRTILRSPFAHFVAGAARGNITTATSLSPSSIHRSGQYGSTAAAVASAAATVSALQRPVLEVLHARCRSMGSHYMTYDEFMLVLMYLARQ